MQSGNKPKRGRKRVYASTAERKKAYDKTRIVLRSAFVEWEEHRKRCGYGHVDFAKHLLSLHGIECDNFRAISYSTHRHTYEKLDDKKLFQPIRQRLKRRDEPKLERLSSEESGQEDYVTYGVVVSRSSESDLPYVLGGPLIPNVTQSSQKLHSKHTSKSTDTSQSSTIPSNDIIVKYEPQDTIKQSISTDEETNTENAGEEELLSSSEDEMPDDTSKKKRKIEDDPDFDPDHSEEEEQSEDPGEFKGSSDPEETQSDLDPNYVSGDELIDVLPKEDLYLQDVPDYDDSVTGWNDMNVNTWVVEKNQFENIQKTLRLTGSEATICETESYQTEQCQEGKETVTDARAPEVFTQQSKALTDNSKQDFHNKTDTERADQNNADGIDKDIPCLCLLCGEDFINEKQFRVHSRSNHSDNIMRCPFCLHHYPGRVRFKIHTRSCKYSNVCHICDETFESFSGVFYHNICKHSDHPFRCVKCGLCCESKTIAISHIEAVHRRNKQLVIHDQEKTEHYDIYCPYNPCAFKSKYLNEVQTHIWMKHKNRKNPYPDFKMHKCGICGLEFHTKMILRGHMSSHSDERKFKCQQCGKSFKKKIALKSHQVIHTGEKPFLCGHCGRRFALKKYLTQHELLHTGEKRHICDKCGEGFAQRNSLNVHLKSRHGDCSVKDGACKDRGKMFNHGIVKAATFDGGRKWSKSINESKSELRLRKKCKIQNSISNDKCELTQVETDSASVVGKRNSKLSELTGVSSRPNRIRKLPAKLQD